MKTSVQWWAETKNDPAKLESWLKKQFVGEVTAANRITGLVDRFNPQFNITKMLYKIAMDENKHALWILDLLQARNIKVPSTKGAEDRYWAQTLPGIKSLDHGLAVGAHAEAMRLERIKVIADDADAPEDIRLTFTNILKDELMHERAFRTKASDEALAETKGNHKLGREALGLVA